MIVTELAGEHPQAPMMQVSGNEATPFAQQLAVVTVPPVEVQSSAAPAIDASPSGGAVDNWDPVGAPIRVPACGPDRNAVLARASGEHHPEHRTPEPLRGHQQVRGNG